MKGQGWKNIVVEGRGGESEEERMWDDGVRNCKSWKGIYMGEWLTYVLTTLNAFKKRVKSSLNNWPPFKKRDLCA